MAQETPVLRRGTAAAAPAGPMIVARFVDGRVVKGTTQDFLPDKASFHVYERGAGRSYAVEVDVDSLKAIFFVRSFEGCREHEDQYSFERTKSYGRKCVVEFKDGETIAGYTSGYSANRPGFFLVPAQEDGNNERIFVVNNAVDDIRWG